MDQHGELRTGLATLVSNGAYHQELVSRSEFVPHGRGHARVPAHGHSDPENDLLVERKERFARMYTGGDPDIGNFDPEQELPRGIWNGSPGPMLRRTTVYD